MKRNQNSSDNKQPYSYLIDRGVVNKNYASIIKVPPPSQVSTVKKSGKKFVKMNYDDILEELGEMGRWQLLHLSLLWLPAMAGGIFVLTYSFTGE